MKWVKALSELSKADQSFVVITILSVEGSAPRAAASKMIVDHKRIYDTIGGGNLEYEAIDKARKLLRENQTAIHRETFTLGKDLTQCCGGKVELLFECFPATNFNIAVFGAGHVGKALTMILRDLPCKVQWFDSRAEQFSEVSNSETGNVQQILMTNTYEAVEHCSPNTYYLIMTHSHETDFELCEAILSRSDIAFCGLIGSKSKAAKFRQRLARKQFTDSEINHLTSPIGLPEVGGKYPMEVAVSVTAQLIHLRDIRKNLSNENHTDEMDDDHQSRVVKLAK